MASKKQETAGWTIALVGLFIAFVVPAVILAWQVFQYLKYGSWVGLPFRETVLYCCRNVFPVDFIRWLEHPQSWFGLHKHLATAHVAVVLAAVGVALMWLGYGIATEPDPVGQARPIEPEDPPRDDTQELLVTTTNPPEGCPKCGSPYFHRARDSTSEWICDMSGCRIRFLTGAGPSTCLHSGDPLGSLSFSRKGDEAVQGEGKTFSADQMGTTRMNLERGFRRITWVISMPLLLIGLAFVGSEGWNRLERWSQLDEPAPSSQDGFLVYLAGSPPSYVWFTSTVFMKLTLDTGGYRTGGYRWVVELDPPRKSEIAFFYFPGTTDGPSALFSRNEILRAEATRQLTRAQQDILWDLRKDFRFPYPVSPPYTSREWVTYVSIVFGIAAVPWGLFYLFRWIALGFRHDPSSGVNR